MGKYKLGEGILSDVSYNNYLVLMCYTDAEWSRQRPSENESEYDLFTRGFRKVFEKCRGYGRGINDNYNEWLNGNERWLRQDYKRAYVEEYLYNPAFYVPFGHA
ncbi:MAG: hypothetical protein JSW47_14270, partial [Phycisphaerales bacterium]